MRKRTIFGIVMLLVVLSVSSMPVVKAVIYVWDGVHFVEGYEGEWIKYPHPDRVYYGISPYSTQGVDGNMLHHFQWDSATSITLVAAADILCAALGAYIGGKMAGLYGAVAGAIIGVALGVVITYVSEAYFLDEYNCIWWWLSLAFMDWAVANAYTLWYYGLTNPVYATSLVLSMLYATGYIRVGALTFLDAIGAGYPSPPPNNAPNTPSRPSGPTTGYVGTYYTYSTSTTDPDGDNVRYKFSWGDGSYTYTSYYSSGATVYASHKWSTTGYKYVKVKAGDIHGEWSGWSSSRTVYISSGGGGCPILSVYAGTAYVEEGLLDIHNADGIDVVASHVLIYTPEPVEHRYLLRLTEHEQTQSHIDQVQLFATLKDGMEIKLPLVSAVHSEDGNVRWKLLLSDDVRADTLGADHNNGTSEYIDLEFWAPRLLEIETFTFIIEGHNIVFKV